MRQRCSRGLMPPGAVVAIMRRTSGLSTVRRRYAQVASGCYRLGYSHIWTITMVPPVAAPVFQSAISLVQLHHQGWGISDKLAGLLTDEREQYKWNATTAAVSQRKIIELETEVARR